VQERVVWEAQPLFAVDWRPKFGPENRQALSDRQRQLLLHLQLAPEPASLSHPEQRILPVTALSRLEGRGVLATWFRPA